MESAVAREDWRGYRVNQNSDINHDAEYIRILSRPMSGQTSEKDIASKQKFQIEEIK